MPYDYKKKTKCKQSSGETGHYLVKRKGSKKPKCYKSKEAFERSRKYKYWAGIEEESKVKMCVNPKRLCPDYSKATLSPDSHRLMQLLIE